MGNHTTIHARTERWMIVLVLLVLVSLVACGDDPRTSGGVSDEVDDLPALVGESVVGPDVDAHEMLDRALVVNVWATWCGPCRREQPTLQRVYERYRARGVEFLGIDYRDNREAAVAWIEEFGVTYPSLFDPDGRTAALLSFPFVPDTYIVDEDGVIRYTIFGETTEDELTGLIEKVLDD